MKYEVKKFKDQQISSKILSAGDLDVHIRGNSYEDLFRAASLKEAWDSGIELSKGYVSKLHIYCLIGQRSDRRFNPKESFDLKVISSFINSMKYDVVEILHPHSDVSLALIEHSGKKSHFQYLEKAYNTLDNPVLVSPDAGAYKITHEYASKLGADLVPSNKARVNGVPEINIQGNVKDRNCLIVDDIADGGRTFKYLAEELKKQGALKVYLYVTHAQFNYGFDELKEQIDHVFCTNSYRNIEDSCVTQYMIDDLITSE